MFQRLFAPTIEVSALPRGARFEVDAVMALG